MTARVLALYRIVVGLAVGVVLVGWLFEFDLFLSDSGPVSLSALAVDTPQGKVAWSLYNISTLRWWAPLLFALTALSTVLLTAGWRSRFAGPLLAALFWSLQSRTAVASDGLDRFLWIALAVGVTLPWDQVWSLEPSGRGSTLKGRMLTLLVAMLIAFALVKPKGELAGFLALGPRATPLPAGVWYVTLAEDGSGKRWNALDQGTPSWDSADRDLLSRRARLYQGRWEEREYHGLAVWWTYRLFHDPKNGGADRRLRAVKLYRCSERQGEPPYRLVASWPMGLSDGPSPLFTEPSQDTP